MTKRELLSLLDPLTDEAEILVLDTDAARYVPAQAKIATRGLQAVIAIEPVLAVKKAEAS